MKKCMTLNEIANKYVDSIYCDNTSILRKEDSKEDFIAGAEWQARQDKRKAVEAYCKIFCSNNAESCSYCEGRKLYIRIYDNL